MDNEEMDMSTKIDDLDDLPVEPRKVTFREPVEEYFEQPTAHPQTNTNDYIKHFIDKDFTVRVEGSLLVGLMVWIASRTELRALLSMFQSNYLFSLAGESGVLAVVSMILFFLFFPYL